MVAAVERVDIAVIGAGVIGSATARALAARGASAVLLEQFGPGHARGSSHGATRIFRLAYPDPGYVRMAMAAQLSWAALQADAGERLLVTTGGLDAGPGAAACAAALAECGVEHAWLEAGELQARFPGIAAAPGERMLFQPGAGASLAGRAVAALQRLAGRGGVPLRTQTQVRSVEARGDHAVLRTSGGDITARVAVIAAGPWNERLLAGITAAPARLTATLQRVRYFAPRDPGHRWPTMIDWAPAGAGWYVVPMAGGAPGVKVASHLPGPAVDPARGPFTAVSPDAEREAAAYVRRPAARPGAGRARARDLPVHDDLGRGFRARPGGTDRGRRRLLGSRVQVRAAARRAAGRPGARHAARPAPGPLRAVPAGPVPAGPGGAGEPPPVDGTRSHRTSWTYSPA